MPKTKSCFSFPEGDTSTLVSPNTRSTTHSQLTQKPLVMLERLAPEQMPELEIPEAEMYSFKFDTEKKVSSW
jgi:hypothetical protein